MKRYFFAVVLAAVTLTSAQAFGRGPVRQFFQGRQAAPVRHTTACQFPQPTTHAVYAAQSSLTSPPASSASVQAKADVQARSNRMFHPGGGFVSGASFEGVGYSTVSPQDALNRCCNNGGPVVAQAVSRGSNGWYAVKQYAHPGQPVRALVQGTLATVGSTVQQTGQVIQNVGTLVLPVRGGTCANGVCK